MKKQSYILAVGLVCLCLLAPVMTQAQTAVTEPEITACESKLFSTTNALSHAGMKDMSHVLKDKLTSADRRLIDEKVQVANNQLAGAKTKEEVIKIIQQFFDSFWKSPANSYKKLGFKTGDSSDLTITIDGADCFFIGANGINRLIKKSEMYEAAKKSFFTRPQPDFGLSFRYRDTKHYDYSPIDLSGITNVKDKLDKILERFNSDEAYTYSMDNPLVKQMAELGEDAVQPLLNMLAHEEEIPIKNRKKAIVDALGYLLAEKHKEVILYYFKEKNMFAKLVKRYRFPEAEDIVMNKIAQGLKLNWNYMWVSHNYDKDVIDLALMLNENRAIPLLIEYVKKNDSPDVAHAAQRLAMIPRLDLSNTLKQAAEQAQNTGNRTALAGLMLDKGMPEGFDYMLMVLEDKSVAGTYYHLKEKCAESITKNTGVMGSPEEMAEWIKASRANLKWNPAIRKFEISDESLSRNDEAEGLFMKALQMETADADYAGALKVYENILEKYKTDKAIADKATARISRCREKLGVEK